MKDPRDIILAPVVSEKSYALIEQGVYTFKVPPTASKPEIRDAVEAIWGVEVLKVNTLNRNGKRKRTRGTNASAEARHQAGHRHPGIGRNPVVRELSASWPFVHASPPAPAVVSRRAPTSARSPRPRRRSRCSSRSRRPVAATATAARPSRHRGGGHKQQYRLVDFKRTKDGVTAKVAAIEYDPNRTCRIALLHYADGEKAYILAPRGSMSATGRERPGRRHQAGQRPADALHPGRYHAPQRRAAPRPGRQDRPLGRYRRAAGRQGGRLRHAPYALAPRCAE